MKLLWTEQSLEDLADIWEYLDRRFSNETADAQIPRLQKDAEGLLALPLMGRSREDLQRGLRSHKSSSYFIFYQVIPIPIPFLPLTPAPHGLAALLNAIYSQE